MSEETEKIIRDIKNTKQAINDSLRDVRGRIDDLHSRLSDDPVAQSGLMRARKEWRGRESKYELNKVIEWLTDPHPNHKLDKAKRWKVGKKLLSPCLIPTFGFNRKIGETVAEGFADRFAAEGWGNFMRFFVAGNWEPHWKEKKIISFPYKWETDFNLQKYNLLTKNQEHFDSLWRRADYFAERYIVPMFSLLDNCSLHLRAQGFWSTHWMNGDNNVNGTHTEAYSQAHWYEEEHKDKPGMRNTANFLLELYHYILEQAVERYGNFFLVEIGNEIDARGAYHIMLRDVIDHSTQQNMTGRVFTSMKHDHFYSNRQVNQACIPIIHGVRDYDDYLSRVELVNGMRHGVAQDGTEPLTKPEQTAGEVVKILRSDTLLYEGNLRPIFEWNGSKWENVCGNEDWTFQSLRYDLFGAYGQAFEEYLG